jgi:hypothetical protein
MIRETVDASSMQIALDGPYGRSMNYSEYSTVVLIAGENVSVSSNRQSADVFHSFISAV